MKQLLALSAISYQFFKPNAFGFCHEAESCTSELNADG
jgi:hypothetical protein